MTRAYYLTFRRVLEPALDGSPRYGEQVTMYTDASPARAFNELRKVKLPPRHGGGAMFVVAYGREGDKPIKDSHPDQQWDMC